MCLMNIWWFDCPLLWKKSCTVYIFKFICSLYNSWRIRREATGGWKATLHYRMKLFFLSIWIITLANIMWDGILPFFCLSFFCFVKKKHFESFGLALRLRPTDFRHISWPWMFLGHKWLLMAMFRLKTRPENIPNTRDSEFCKLDWIWCWMLLSCITTFKAAFLDLL